MSDDRLTPREHDELRDLVLAGTHRIKPVGAHRMQIIAASVALVLVAGVTGGAVATASMLGSAPVQPAVTSTPAPSPSPTSLSSPSTSPTPSAAPNPRKDAYEAEIDAWPEALPPGYSWPAWDDLPHAGGLYGLQPQDNAAGVYRCMLVSAAWFAYFESNDPVASKDYATRADAYRLPDDDQWTPAVTEGGVIIDDQLSRASGLCQGISGPLP